MRTIQHQRKYQTKYLKMYLRDGSSREFISIFILKYKHLAFFFGGGFRTTPGNAH